MAREDFDVFGKNPANYVPLTPLSFLRRAAEVHGDHPSVIHGARRYTWGQTYERCVRLASALAQRGIGRNDVVSFVCPNIPEMIEAHFAVNMAGGVLNTINTRLDADTIAYILEHSESRLIFCDVQFSPVVKEALAILGDKAPDVIDIVDSEAPDGECLGTTTHEDLLASGDPAYDWQMPADEWDAMAINYTSGTTGRPKGVVYHHRGAYLIAIGTIMGWPLPKHPKYVYIVPLFHCNGWGHAWAMAAQAGTMVCTRAISAKAIYDAAADHGAQYFGGAPVVLQMLINAKPEEKRNFDHTIEAFTAGAPPPPAVLAKMETLGVNVQHVYGLTETYGHVTQCDWKGEWNDLPPEDRAEIKGRQGPRMAMFEGATAVDLETGAEVAHDGGASGEIMLRGNTVMKGYFKNPEATEEAFKGGWFHSGDAAAIYPGGYLKIRDRLKDVIISGGENVSSVEVEAVLFKYPGVVAAAVVARPDDTWGETPCAFVEMAEDKTATPEEIIAFCRQHLAGFKTPKTVIFEELPKTSTGKIQKFMLREKARNL